MSFLQEQLGDELTIKNVVVGTNLNVRVIRGYASIRELALISAPDVYSQLNNKFGTQRSLDKSHSKQVFQYAMESLEESSTVSPRAFPEIILNARDIGVINLVETATNLPIEIDSNDDQDAETITADLVIDVRSIEYGREINPQISRVDGNHRLQGASTYLVEEGENPIFPMVPFSLFVGLSPQQERALFKDINGEQKTMDTAHLTTIRAELAKESQLLENESGRALWIAERLQEEGKPFEGMVFRGGDKKAFKAAGLSVPPIGLNALQAAVLTTMKGCRNLSLIELKSGNEDQIEQDNLHNAKALSVLLTRFWNAVKKAYPDAWQDKSNYILLQSIGMTGFSKLASVIIDQGIKDGKTKQSDFELVLGHIASKVALVKSNWAGFAGAAGATKVFEELNSHANEGLNVTVAISQIFDDEISPLDQS